ncbi:MFS transporter [Streptomyces coeruleorubidus]|uniref:MFS transporter n=1 Tax=Streptomyces coeruleorubidus TaxID=116188 RepID=UPI0019B76105|nr:MFS transporter [Streptomyces coeruleorubidus]GGU00617.1 hypothetical protein GCM10010256_70800 [Streptomyces coeruleorubidus]
MANAFKGITETLVPDYVAPSHRGKAQGFVKAGVSLTIVVSSLISLLVVDRRITLAFAIPPVLMLLLLATSWFFLGRRHHAATLSHTGQPSATETHPVAKRPSADFASPWDVIKDSGPTPTRQLCTAFPCNWSSARTTPTQPSSYRTTSAGP